MPGAASRGCCSSERGGTALTQRGPAAATQGMLDRMDHRGLVLTALRGGRPRGTGPSFFEVVARDGPKWGPGIAVDVVVRLRDGAGHEVLLQARAQWINRTD